MNQYSERERKKERIIKAAYKAVIEKGMNSLTLQDIADKAYVSKGITLYYFKNKDDILLSLLDWVKIKIMNKLNSEVCEGKDPVDKIRDLVNTWFNGLKVNKKFYLLYLEFLSNKGLRDKRFKELSTSFYKEYNSMISKVVSEGIDKGIFRKIDPKVAVSIIWGLIDGLSAQLLFEKNSHTCEIYKKNCEEAILIYLKNNK
jgi:AcrR family transcriptional regulator